MSNSDQKCLHIQNLDIKIKEEPVEDTNLINFAIKQEPEEEFELAIPENQKIKSEDEDEPRSCKKIVIFPKEYEKAAPHKCQVCGKRFSDIFVLQQHKTIHEKTAICEICKIEVKQKLLSLHIKNKHEQKITFECPTCHAQFKIESNLQHHIKKHEMKFVYKIEK